MSTDRYLVTARKYRPKRFDEVVAQKHVSDTLKNAIRQDRLAHAYLFSGPRGVGKTTAARVLAKAINCTTPLAERPDGSEPCLECDSCKSFAEGRSLNVIEIDAASNRGVDDARELRDTVRIPPQGARKKVYIVDEVHMLTKEAFNTLLKTLEEPPAHALFILATTEPHKVLATIVSRCQRFDFRRISVVEIVRRLEEIARLEDVVADEASLLLIARKGDGALRDSLSVFDQAVSLCGSNLEYQVLADALGVVDADFFFEASGFARDGDAAGMMRLVQRLVAEGYDFREFLSGLALHLRNLLVAVTLPDSDLIEETRSVRERYMLESEGFTRSDLLRLLMVASETESALRGSAHPRLQFEMGLLKMASMIPSLDLREAVTRIEEMARKASTMKGETVSSESRRSGGAAPVGDRIEDNVPRKQSAPSTPDSAASDAGIPSPSASPSRRDSSAVAAADAESETEIEPPAVDGAEAAAREDRAETERAEPAADVSPPAAEAPADSGARADEEAKPEATQAESTSEPDDGDAGQRVPASSPGAPNLFGPPALSTSSDRPIEPPGTRASAQGSAALAATFPAVAAPETSTAEEAPSAPDPRLRSVESDWLGFVRRIKEERIHVGSLLQHCAPGGLHSDTLSVDVPDDFHRRLLSNQAGFLTRYVQSVLEPSIRGIEFTVKTGVASEAPAAEDLDPHEYMKIKRKENEVVRAIFEEFGGEMVW